jgi:hypothetical protein
MHRHAAVARENELLVEFDFGLIAASIPYTQPAIICI